MSASKNPFQQTVILNLFQDLPSVCNKMPKQVRHDNRVFRGAQLFKSDTIVNAVKAYDDVIVELIDETLVQELKLDPSGVKDIDCRGLIVTAKGNPPYDFVSRFFAPRVGVNEDPVTGSAHCKLADYWQKNLGKREFLAYQASSRGGVLELTVIDNRVLLKGQAVTVMEGKLLVGIL